MKINFSTSTPEEQSRILQWAEDLIRRGAECSVEISGEAQPAPEPKPQKRELNGVAMEVYQGKWGVDPLRTVKLKAAGYTMSEIKEIRKIVSDLVYN